MDNNLFQRIGSALAHLLSVSDIDSTARAEVEALSADLKAYEATDTAARQAAQDAFDAMAARVAALTDRVGVIEGGFATIDAQLNPAPQPATPVANETPASAPTAEPAVDPVAEVTTTTAAEPVTEAAPTPVEVAAVDTGAAADPAVVEDVALTGGDTAEAPAAADPAPVAEAGS